MIASYIHAVFLALLTATATPSDVPQHEVPNSEVQIQNAPMCGQIGPLFMAVYDLYANKVERVVVDKMLLDQLYDAFPGMEGAKLAAVVRRSINVLYSVEAPPDKVSWYYMVQLMCVNFLGSDIAADQHSDFLGKPKQRQAREQQ